MFGHALSISSVAHPVSFAPPQAAPLQLSATPEGDFILEGARDTITITVIEPISEIGTYDVTIPASITGPVEVSAVRVIGATAPRRYQELRSEPALWLYAGTADPMISYQWLRDGVPIPGATGQTYILTADDVGAAIILQETADQSGGPMQFGYSLSHSAPTAPVVDSSYIFQDVFDSYSLGDDIPTMSVDWEVLSQSGTASFEANGAGGGVVGNTQFNDALAVAFTGDMPDDAFAEIAFDSYAYTNWIDAGVFLRGNAAGTSQVEAMFVRRDNTLRIRETIGGSFSDTTFSGYDITPGDVLRLEVVGTVATLKLNETVIGTRTGLTVASGRAGLRTFLGRPGDAWTIQRITAGPIGP